MTKPREQPEKLLPAFIKDAKARVSAARLGLPKRKVKASTAAEYARRAKRVEDAGGKLDLVGVGKSELALWKAALKWRAAERIREACDEAERIWGLDYEKEAERWKAYERAVKQVKVALWKKEETEHALKQMAAVPKSEVVPKQARHKKQPFAAGDVSKLLAAVGDSPLRPAYLAAYFCGARPEEFADGVRLTRGKENETGRPGILLTIVKRAKQGEGKGQESGRIFIPDESIRSPEAKAIFDELRRLCMRSGGRALVKVEPTEKLTVGQRLRKV